MPGQVIVCENEGASWLPFHPFATLQPAISRIARSHMDKRLIRLAPLFLIGCTAPTIGLHVQDERADRSEAIDVLQACDTIDLECRLYSEPHFGVITVRLVDDAGPEIAGKTEGRDGCRRQLRAEPSVETIGHELGHIFGLEHVRERDNLMYDNSDLRTSDELHDEQFDAVQRDAALFSECAKLDHARPW